jgi:hypothetical protein
MNIEGLQDLLDRVRITSWQRWMFIVIAIASLVGASMITSHVAGQVTGVLLALVLGLSALASARADTHTGFVAGAVVVWQWLATVDDVSSPWAVAIAVCLLVFHTLLALMAVTPITAVVAPPVAQRWVRRTLVVAAATLAVWTCVLVFDQRQTPGSVLLTVSGFVTLTVLVFLARATSEPSDQLDTH